MCPTQLTPQSPSIVVRSYDLVLDEMLTTYTLKSGVSECGRQSTGAPMIACYKKVYEFVRDSSTSYSHEFRVKGLK